MIKFCTQTQPGVLPYFMEDFCKLISHEAKIVRNNAYELFVKLLRFDPNLSQQLIVPFIGCLESNDASIAGKKLTPLKKQFKMADKKQVEKKVDEISKTITSPTGSGRI